MNHNDESDAAQFERELAAARNLMAVGEKVATHTIVRPDGRQPFPELAERVEKARFQAFLHEQPSGYDQILVWCAREVENWLKDHPEWSRERRANLLTTLVLVASRGY